MNKPKVEFSQVTSNGYTSKIADKKGLINYSDTENTTWNTLYNRQRNAVENKACDEFLHGLDALQLDSQKVPQVVDVNRKLASLSQWQLQPVPALIGFGHFFRLLANRQFPVATFIRRPEDLDYIKEPDIFHEIFGHCPLLTNPAYADFSQKYGQLGLAATPEQRKLLARLYWFTIEFGLIKTEQGMKIYGGGILSSQQETSYSLNSKQVNRQPLDPLVAMRTAYRIDELQKSYFYIEELKQLDNLIALDLEALMFKATKLGLLNSNQVAKENAAC